MNGIETACDGLQPCGDGVAGCSAARNRSAPPRPADLLHLRPSNLAGSAALATVALTTAAGLALSSQGPVAIWLAGQLVLALAFVQWFVLLHECGHDTLVRDRRWHGPVGHVAGFFALIPYPSWTRVHGRHHRWTGWQDLDPTTEALVPRARSRLERAIVNVCWQLWVPIFAVTYRVANYWHVPRLLKLFPEPRARRRIAAGALLLGAAYLAAAVLVGPWTLLRLAGVAIVLSLMAEDVLLLSQHTHVPQHVSHGAPVQPFAAMDQAPFTRSLRLPAWLSAMLLHFDAHELHHMYPFVPGYRLRDIPLVTDHEVGWWRWTRSARRLRGEVFLFQNRTQSGWDL